MKVIFVIVFLGLICCNSPKKESTKEITGLYSIDYAIGDLSLNCEGSKYILRIKSDSTYYFNTYCTEDMRPLTFFPQDTGKWHVHDRNYIELLSNKSVNWIFKIEFKNAGIELNSVKRNAQPYEGLTLIKPHP